jgi:glycosyltransferase involved in cell wall biosynthesis
VRLSHRFSADYDFHFVFLGAPGPVAHRLRDAGFPVHIIERRSGPDWRCSHRLFVLLERLRPELIHAHQSRAFFHGMMARIFYQRPPILFTEHARRYPDTPPAERVAAARMLLESRDRIVAASQSIRRALILNEGLPSGQTEVIYHGLTPAGGGGAPPAEPSVRPEIGVAAEAFLILQVAPFEPVQDHPLAIDALEQVVRRLPEARLALVGDGPEEASIRALIRRRGLESQVLFLGQRTDGARLLAAADLVLLTSWSAEFPPVLLEALAAGRPVVAPREGGAGEIIEDRVSGLLVGPGDAVGLAETLIRLHDDPALRARLGRRGGDRIRAMFSETRTALGYAQLYQAMLSP